MKKESLVFTVIAVMFVLMNTNLVWADLVDGLVAHWTFDEGLISVSNDYKILISKKLNTNKSAKNIQLCGINN